MDAEVTLFSKPEELIAWADTFDILLNPSIEDAAIMLNYMEGHDYAIGIDSDGKMYRQDVAEENGIMNCTSIRKNMMKEAGRQKLKKHFLTDLREVLHMLRVRLKKNMDDMKNLSVTILKSSQMICLWQ